MASEKKEQEKKEKGLSFFTKLKNSIFKIEKYPEMAIEGFGKAVLYISKILIYVVEVGPNFISVPFNSLHKWLYSLSGSIMYCFIPNNLYLTISNFV